MLDQVDGDVLAWAEALADPGAVRLGLPAGEAPDSGLYLHLFDFRQDSQEHAPRQSTWRFVSRYLVSACSEDARESHRLLAHALIHAIESDRFEVERESPSLALWQALRVPARPAFVLAAPWSHQREKPQGPLVRRPLQMDWGELQPLSGSVLGPSDVPIMLARVEIPHTGLSAATDWRGRVPFPPVLPAAAKVPPGSAPGERAGTPLQEATAPEGHVVSPMEQAT